MVFDPVWLALLLPIAAGTGWIAGRHDPGPKNGDSKRGLTSDYFRGLNYLLNEQPDKAIEVFIKMMEVDSETVEMHLALGNLFRKRGEIERATRIHQNLIERPNLNKTQQFQALYELAQDFYSAGLLDRAEALFTELIDDEQRSVSSLKYLCKIYEGEKEWEKGIEAQKILAKKLHTNHFSVIAHYYCQLAEEEVFKGNLVDAIKYLKTALSEDRYSSRALLLKGEIEYKLGNYDIAIKSWTQLYQSGEIFIGEIIDKYIDSYKKAKQEKELARFIHSMENEHHNPSMLKAKVGYLIENEGIDCAGKYLERMLSISPSGQGIREYIHLIKKNSDVDKQMLNMIEDYLDSDTHNNKSYLCRQCGFKGRLLHWQCPSCKQWDTTMPMASDIGHVLDNK